MAKRKLTAKQKRALELGRRKLLQKNKLHRVIGAKTTRRKKVAKVANKRKRKAKRRTQPTMLAGMSGILGAVAYGAAREQISTFIAESPIGQQLPSTQFTDEAVMLALNWGARKVGLGRNPLGNSVLRAQRTVELSRLGQGLVDVFITQKANNVANNGNAQQVVVLQ